MAQPSEHRTPRMVSLKAIRLSTCRAALREGAVTVCVRGSGLPSPGPASVGGLFQVGLGNAEQSPTAALWCALAVDRNPL
jgi:hypothetical protein